MYGRSGRQGDSGGVRLFFSLDDLLFRRFLPEPLLRLARRLPAADTPTRRLAGWLLRLTQRWAEFTFARSRWRLVEADRWREEYVALPASGGRSNE